MLCVCELEECVLYIKYTVLSTNLLSLSICPETYSHIFISEYFRNILTFTIHGTLAEGKPSSAKKRRKSSSSAVALGKTALSPAASFNPAGMTERQQMAYLLQMTDPQKKNGVYQ